MFQHAAGRGDGRLAGQRRVERRGDAVVDAVAVQVGAVDHHDALAVTDGVGDLLGGAAATGVAGARDVGELDLAAAVAVGAAHRHREPVDGQARGRGGVAGGGERDDDRAVGRLTLDGADQAVVVVVVHLEGRALVACVVAVVDVLRVGRVGRRAVHVDRDVADELVAHDRGRRAGGAGAVEGGQLCAEGHGLALTAVLRHRTVAGRARRGGEEQRRRGQAEGGGDREQAVRASWDLLDQGADRS